MDKPRPHTRYQASAAYKSDCLGGGPQNTRGMSDFFGNLRNPRMPEIVMNQGPLPPLSTDGMPYGLNGTADAKINYKAWTTAGCCGLDAAWAITAL